IGKDHAGRWLFRDPAQLGTRNSELRTLILDPTLPDPIPKLPVWTYRVDNGTVGWDQRDWPVIKAGSAFAIEEASFRVLADKDRMFTKLEKILTSQTATTQSALGPPVLMAPEGTYYDGRTNLALVSTQGKLTTWSLPTSASGTLSPW